MFSRLRRPFTYANVAATLALVFAMAGGAYAAKHYLITSTSQISPKVLAALKGKPGAGGSPGAQGAQGPQGPAGPAGSAGKGEKGEKGDPGTNGANGANGAPGASGKSVVIGEATGHCPENGTSVEVEGSGAKRYICDGEAGTNGKNGAAGATGPSGPTGSTGPTGSPWTAGGTLPHGSTETGVWSATGMPVSIGIGAHGAITASISFPIPLAKAPEVENVIGEGEGEHEANENLPAGCKGNVNEPKAEPGDLCIFVALGINATFNAGAVESATGEGGGEPGKTGAEVFGLAEKSEGVSMTGTWAVTGE
ncbi:MAG TPA: hypothetical protein VMG80_00290 [Solirubrobacteraceae bacterium]|nr:hypothetical protein [Solirubrobacteraceae bacterium]